MDQQQRIESLEAQVRQLRSALDPFAGEQPEAPEPPPELRPDAPRKLSECDLVLEHFPAEDMVEARVQGRRLALVPRLAHALGTCINAYRQIPLGSGLGHTHVGILGDVGAAVFGAGWHQQSSRTVAGPCDFTLHGMDAQAAAIVGWGNTYGNVSRLEMSRLQLYGATDSFVIRANDEAGWILMNECTLDPGPHQEPYGGRASFIHWDNIHGLCIQNCRTLEGSRVTEHIVYGKSIRRGGLFILNNHFRGANRCVIQIRPEQGLNLVPDGPVVIRGNDFADHGHAWGPQDGGATISVWASPIHPVFIENNDCSNSEYGAILVTGDQDPPSRQFVGYEWQIAQAVVRRNNTSAAVRYALKCDNIGELWTDTRPVLGTLYGPTYGIGAIRRTS